MGYDFQGQYTVQKTRICELKEKMLEKSHLANPTPILSFAKDQISQSVDSKKDSRLNALDGVQLPCWHGIIGFHGVFHSLNQLGVFLNGRSGLLDLDLIHSGSLHGSGSGARTRRGKGRGRTHKGQGSDSVGEELHFGSGLMGFGD